MSLIAPLDLEQIFVVNLAGTVEIFSFVAVLLISFACAYFKMSNKNALVMFALFAVIMAAYLPGLYVLTILVAGMITYFSVARFFR